MKVTSVICARNAADYIVTCLRHLAENGVDVVLVDNESEDATVARARPFLSHNLICIEKLPWEGCYDLPRLLALKAKLFRQLSSDWWIHQDVDEIPVADRAGESLQDAFKRLDTAGSNAVNFNEFVFMPENGQVRYEGCDYVQGMRHYYFFDPWRPRLMRAWKHAGGPHFAEEHAGHLLNGNVRLYPGSFLLRHYMHLSWQHVLEKYPTRKFAPAALAKGWHVNRINLKPEQFHQPELSSLRRWDGSDLAALDVSDPKSSHFWQWDG